MDENNILINLVIGIFCTLLGTFIGYRLAKSKKEKDDRLQIIRDVAEKYRHFVETNKTSGIDGLIRAGITRLRNNSEIKESIKIIMLYGNRDPLSSFRDKLFNKDIHNFLNIIQKNNLDIWKQKDIEIAITETKKLK